MNHEVTKSTNSNRTEAHEFPSADYARNANKNRITTKAPRNARDTRRLEKDSER